MTRGMYFTEREEAYIIENHERKSHSEILEAELLGELFSEDNGGYRSKGGVQAFMQRERRAGRIL